MAASFALLGSSFATAVRVTFGHWVPSFRQLVYSNVRAPQVDLARYGVHSSTILLASVGFGLACHVMPALFVLCALAHPAGLAAAAQQCVRQWHRVPGGATCRAQAALAYLAVWGLVGLAVTYYYDADDQQVWRPTSDSLPCQTLIPRHDGPGVAAVPCLCGQPALGGKGAGGGPHSPLAVRLSTVPTLVTLNTQVADAPAEARSPPTARLRTVSTLTFLIVHAQVAEALAEGRSPPAVRLRTILKYALKLAGLALVGIGTSLPEASAALACALVAYEGLASARHALCIRRRLPHACTAVCRL